MALRLILPEPWLVIAPVASTRMELALAGVKFRSPPVEITEPAILMAVVAADPTVSVSVTLPKVVTV